MKMDSWGLLRVALGLGLVVGVVAACSQPATLATHTERPECPTHDSLLVPVDNERFVRVNQLAVPGPTSRVAEFHDCQRLLDAGGTGYGPLVAVFGSRFLDSVAFGIDSMEKQPNLHLKRSSEVGASALVLSYDGEYAPLGIRQNFNCLYLFDSPGEPSGMAARMVPVGMREPDCDAVFDVAAAGTGLEVRRVRAEPSFRHEDYPPVARWDYDPVSRAHTIGIKCGSAWCEVGQRGHQASAGLASTDADSRERRALKVKGWYDEQTLAIESSGTLVPGGSVGTFIPAKDLGQLTTADFARWRLAARVMISPHSPVYEAKFGYTASANPSQMNQIFLCSGSWNECQAPGDPSSPPTCSKPFPSIWWAKIVNTQGAATYRCVFRRTHPGLRIPGTTRWRWLLKDETKWMACDNGCCEIDGET